MTGPLGKAQMSHRDRRHAQAAGARHRWLNRLQTALLVLTLLGIAAVAGSLLLGDSALWLALAAAGFTLLLEPAAASGLTLRLYGARPLHPNEAPDLWAVLRELAARAGLPAVPVPHYVPSGVVNAFATGTKHHAAIALTDGLLRSLTLRELTGDPQGLALALAKIERESRAWLLPGWGNPEPSWLRTHPATPERIQRLRELADSMAPQPLHSSPFLPDIPLAPRPPRWRASGVWR